MKPFEEIWIDRQAQGTWIADRIAGNPGDARIRIVSGREEADELLGADQAAFATDWKQRLFVTREQGRFLKRCPGTPGARCCNLFVLNPIVGCPFDCTYCFLQAYQNEPFITLYANLEDLDEEIDALKCLNPGRNLRICTGELADSLALEPMAGVAAFLVERFAAMEGACLELKTKSADIGHLLDLDHEGRTVISWTLNTQTAAADEEQGVPPPDARLEAARLACRAGYPVAFHFDPLVRHERWKQDYCDLVRTLFDNVPPPSIRWISLGGFRYTPAMKGMIKARFPGTRLFLG
ncbi:MAG: SPL family radical SAM protein, partial [Planctomycetota bacterium]